MPHRILTTPQDVENFCTLLPGMSLPVTLSWVKGRDRTQQQNALQWLWATEVADQLADRAPQDVQDTWRLEHGVPILRADDAEFCVMYDRCIKPLPYEMKKNALRRLGIKITSAFKVGQMVRYMDAVQRACLEFGLEITEPDRELAEYQARFRKESAA